MNNKDFDQPCSVLVRGNYVPNPHRTMLERWKQWRFEWRLWLAFHPIRKSKKRERDELIKTIADLGTKREHDLYEWLNMSLKQKPISFPEIWRGFDLRGLKVGDEFVGCEDCHFQLPVGVLSCQQCPHCLQDMYIFTVTKEDILAAP